MLPAYNASKTLEKTYHEIDFNIVDDVILVDDLSKDNTVDVGKKLGIKHIIVHEENKGTAEIRNRATIKHLKSAPTL